MQLSESTWHQLVGAPIGPPTVQPLLTGRGISAQLYVLSWGADESGVLKISHERERGLRELAFLRTVDDSSDVPRLIGSLVEPERVLLLLEDLRDATPGDILVGATPAQALAAMDVLGRLHASWWNAPPPGWTFEPPRWAPTSAPHIAQFQQRYPHPWAQQRLNELPARVAQMTPVLAAAPPSLMHADAHLDNWMFRPQPILVDWESVRVGPAIVDVIRFLVEGLTPTVRRPLQPALLERWRAALPDVTAQHVDSWLPAALWYTINAVVRHHGSVDLSFHSDRIVQVHHQCAWHTLELAADVLG